MAAVSPFDRAGQFFGTAFNDLEQASDAQARQQGAGVDNARFSANYDQNYLFGSVPPQMGPYGENQSTTPNVESVKEDLLSAARERRRPTNGHISIRAGGGINPAVKS